MRRACRFALPRRARHPRPAQRSTPPPPVYRPPKLVPRRHAHSLGGRMHMWTWGRVAACATAAVLALVAAAPAAADDFEPLNPYLVSGDKASADELARKGYDLLEGHGKRGKFGIVATAKQAEKLRGEGMKVEAPAGEATRPMEAPQAANPL